MICQICGAEIGRGAYRQHEQWHIDLDLRLDLMQSVIEALVKNQKRDGVTDVTPGPPGRDRGQGVVSLVPKSARSNTRKAEPRDTLS